MLISYFKIAIRYLLKNRIYSFINVTGLCLGLACAMLIILYTKDELSFDKFQKDIGSTYLIAIDVQNPDGSSFDKMGITSALYGQRFKDNLPEVESFVRMMPIYRTIKLKEEVTSQVVMVADGNFFSFFSFPLIRGNPLTALQDPHNIVITEDMAIRHFGDSDALGKTILLESEGAFVPYTVTGVAKRCPQNSSIQFEAVLPLQLAPADLNWVASLSYSTFMKLHQASDKDVVSLKMQKVFEAESRKEMEQVRQYGFTQSFRIQLQPFAEIHLSEDYKAEVGLTNGSHSIYSFTLSGIAAFILVIACINFINLTIARSVKRAREIGIRKVVGSGRQQLIAQFLGESFLLCLLSFVGAMILAWLLLPVFNDLVNKELSLSYLIDNSLIAIYVSLFLLTGLLAGFYPAIVLSGYNPVQTLYTRFKLSGKNYLQRSLIVFQFALATFMVIGTITIYMQLDYLTTRDLGFEPNNIVKVNKRNLSYREARIFSEALAQSANIISTSPQLHWSENGKVNGDTIMHFSYETVNENFVDLMQIRIIRGRNFSPQTYSDSANSVLVNQAFVEQAGWTEPLGQEVRMMNGATRRVIGIVQDYHYESLKRPIEPQVLSLAFPDIPTFQHLLIRIQPESEASCLPFIEQTFKKLFPMHSYTYQFYDEANLISYEAEAKWKQIVFLSAMLTILIAGVGLFGLSILTAESRVKEVGIRKVFGASVASIVINFYKHHLYLISLALVMAIPAAYYASNVWLKTYPYRIEVGVGAYVAAGLFVMVIAGMTISYQTVKTALSNPVDSLRSE